MTSTGSTVTVEGIDYVVIWNGEEGLIGPRESKPPVSWTAPPRQYNKTGNHKKNKDKQLDLTTLGDDNE